MTTLVPPMPKISRILASCDLCAAFSLRNSLEFRNFFEGEKVGSACVDVFHILRELSNPDPLSATPIEPGGLNAMRSRRPLLTITQRCPVWIRNTMLGSHAIPFHEFFGTVARRYLSSLQPIIFSVFLENVVDGSHGFSKNNSG